ncbi:MAG: HD domain-containing protein [Candidatus Paceibacterota bacterium]
MEPSIIEKAAALAAEGHKEQYRKHENIPYVVHPFMVSQKLAEHGFGEDVMAAGLAHDLLEDTDISQTRLRNVLGQEVLDIVEGVSENKSLPWEGRKKEYIERVKNSDEKIKAVCVADKIHNLQNTLYEYEKQGEKIWSVFNASREKQLWFYKAIVEMLDQSGWEHSIVEEYKELVQCLENIFPKD